MIKSKPCRVCNSTWHTAMYHKKRKPLKVNKLPSKTGKVQKKTNAAVAQWKRTQKPNHRGNYICYICKTEVPYLMAEHVKSKVRHPELRTETNNMKSVCSSCNDKKRSEDN